MPPNASLPTTLPKQMLQPMLEVRLEALGAFVVLASALFAVLSRDSLGSAGVGLALSYALGVTKDITWLVRSYCDLQK